MSHEIVTQDFYGKPVQAHARDGALWFTSEQACVVLSVKDRNTLLKLFRLHKSELVEGVEYAYAKLAVATSGAPSSPQVRRVLCLSMQGVEFFALLVRGEAGRRARRWVVDLRASLRAKDKVIANPEALNNKIVILEHHLAQANAALAEAYQKHVAHLEDVTARVFDMSKVQASTIAWLLGKRGAQKRLEKKLLDEIGRGQKFLPGLSDENGTAPVNRLPKGL